MEKKTTTERIDHVIKRHFNTYFEEQNIKPNQNEWSALRRSIKKLIAEEKKRCIDLDLVTKFESRNNLSVSIEAFEDGSGNIKDFWNEEEVLFEFLTLDLLDIYLNEVHLKKDEDGYCIDPAQVVCKCGSEEVCTKFPDQCQLKQVKDSLGI